MMTTARMTELAHENPRVWWAGWDASKAGKMATACPYTPMNEDMMMVWLSGHVSATEDTNGSDVSKPDRPA